MKIVVGLGNPGREYESTPHNAGFDVLDRLAARCGARLKRSLRFSSRLGKAEMPGAGQVLLVQPQTFMNRSGDAVSAILHYYRIAMDELVVVVDDADLPMGCLRIRAEGGTGGHRGLASIIESCGGNQFARIRIGIGRARTGESGDLVKHVLSPFSEPERIWMGRIAEQAADAVGWMLREGAQAAMNRFNGLKIADDASAPATGEASG